MKPQGLERLLRVVTHILLYWWETRPENIISCLSLQTLSHDQCVAFLTSIFQTSAMQPKRASYSTDTDLESSLLHQLDWAGQGVPMYLAAPKKDKEKRVDSWPLLTWRAFLQCVSGCGCWAWWPQQTHDHSSHTWKAGHWSEWPRGSSVLMAGKRTGSSGHTGRVWNK